MYRARLVCSCSRTCVRIEVLRLVKPMRPVVVRVFFMGAFSSSSLLTPNAAAYTPSSHNISRHYRSEESALPLLVDSNRLIRHRPVQCADILVGCKLPRLGQHNT